MSELEARKYTSIRMLREEIRQNLEDFKLLYSNDQNGKRCFFAVLCADELDWFSRYLIDEIENSVLKLKQLVVQENE